MTNCPGTDSSTLNNNYCTIPIPTLINAPFNLLYGSIIYSKVAALNLVGTGSYSSVGFGAVILRQPDAPLNFANNPSILSMTEIGLTWTPGSNNGGTEVIDYRITYAADSNSFIVLATGITSTSYSATYLTPGTTYSFYV